MTASSAVYVASDSTDTGEDWRVHAACRQYPQAWWFPPPKDSRRPNEGPDNFHARSICVNECPVRAECLADGMVPIRFISQRGLPAHGQGMLPHGIMGGLDEREREAMRDNSCG